MLSNIDWQHFMCQELLQNLLISLAYLILIFEADIIMYIRKHFISQWKH